MTVVKVVLNYSVCVGGGGGVGGPTDRSWAVPPLQFFFRVSVVSYVTFCFVLVYSLTHLYLVDSSTLSLWTGLFLGCLISLWLCYTEISELNTDSVTV